MSSSVDAMAPDDSARTERAVGNGNLRPWKPGQSGNPLGKRKSLEALVRRETHNGADITRFMARVLRGEPYEYPTLPPGPHRGVAFLPSPQERLEAARWLADRAFGRAPQVVEATVDVDATVNHVETLRAHLAEADVDRLVVALLGSGEEAQP